MNGKLKIYLLSYIPIGNTARNNVFFKAKCQTTKKVFRSPVFNQNSSPFTQTPQFVWEFQLYQNQTELLIKMIIIDAILKTQKIISQAKLSKLDVLSDQAEVIFYTGRQRIGALNFRTQREKPQEKVQNKIKNQQFQTFKGTKIIQSKKKMKPHFDQSQEDSQNQRYNVQFTPHQTINNSVVKLTKVQDNSYIHIFKQIDQSSIEQREPFSKDESFYLSDAVQSRAKMGYKNQSRIILNNSKSKQKEKLNFLQPQIITSNQITSKQSPSKIHAFKNQIKSRDTFKEKYKDQKQTNFIKALSQYRIQKEPSSLQKWLKKLQKFHKQKQKQSFRRVQYECVFSQKFKQKKSNYPQKQLIISLNLINLTIDSTVDEYYSLKSLKMKVIDEKNRSSGEILFQCKFSRINQNDQRKSKWMKLNKLMTLIPEDKNVEVHIWLDNEDEDSQEIKISGIFIKDKLIDTDQIPLFDQDQNLFATLSYKVKTIKSVSVQYLSPLNSLTESEELQKSEIHEQKELHQATKHLIRQRKINKLQKKQLQYAFQDNQSPRKNIDLIGQKSSKQTLLNSSVRAKIQRDFSLEKKANLSPDSGPKNRKDSPFLVQFQRSNTDIGPYTKQPNKLESEAERQSKSSRSPSIKQLKDKIIKIHDEISQFTGNVSLPVSFHNNPQNRFKLKSNTLADLREQQSQEQESDGGRAAKFQVSQKAGSEMGLQMPLFSPKKVTILKKLRTQPDRNVSTGLEETIHHRKDLGAFIIEINTITVVLYERKKSEEQENGKFIILKSQSGQTFITDTLFSNHLNLNWKNRFYQFTSSKIEIGIYEKTGVSSQSQNNLRGKVEVKLIDLMKAIKQNFHRAEIFFNGKPIGIVILIYDIFLEKQFAINIHEIHQERRNNSEIKIKNHTQKVTSPINQTEQQRYYVRGSEKSTIKVGKQKNRKRAKTLQSKKRYQYLPAIDRINMPSRKRPSYYEGGKNITIGRAERFLNANMAEVVGEM